MFILTGSNIVEHFKHSHLQKYWTSIFRLQQNYHLTDPKGAIANLSYV